MTPEYFLEWQMIHYERRICEELINGDYVKAIWLLRQLKQISNGK